MGSSEQKRDADPKRMMVFEESLEKARTHYFKQVCGVNRMLLRLLVTHPDYQRRGAGGKLVKWGIEKAKEDNLAITLFASSTGGHLYRKLGFRGLGVIKIQVDGEIESVSKGLMAYVPTCDEACGPVPFDALDFHQPMRFCLNITRYKKCRWMLSPMPRLLHIISHHKTST